MTTKAATTLIYIGHGAYQGTNSLRMCFSKAQAVRVLRARGVKRDDARKAVNSVCATSSGYSCVRAGFDPIEVRNAQRDLEQGYFLSSVENLRKYWATQPEA